jgi:hypothetical protein
VALARKVFACASRPHSGGLAHHLDDLHLLAPPPTISLRLTNHTCPAGARLSLRVTVSWLNALASFGGLVAVVSECDWPCTAHVLWPRMAVSRSHHQPEIEVKRSNCTHTHTHTHTHPRSLLLSVRVRTSLHSPTCTNNARTMAAHSQTCHIMRTVCAPLTQQAGNQKHVFHIHHCTNLHLNNCCAVLLAWRLPLVRSTLAHTVASHQTNADASLVKPRPSWVVILDRDVPSLHCQQVLTHTRICAACVCLSIRVGSAGLAGPAAQDDHHGVRIGGVPVVENDESIRACVCHGACCGCTQVSSLLSSQQQPAISMRH